MGGGGLVTIGYDTRACCTCYDLYGVMVNDVL